MMCASRCRPRSATTPARTSPFRRQAGLSEALWLLSHPARPFESLGVLCGHQDASESGGVFDHIFLAIRPTSPLKIKKLGTAETTKRSGTGREFHSKCR